MAIIKGSRVILTREAAAMPTFGDIAGKIGVIEAIGGGTVSVRFGDRMQVDWMTLDRLEALVEVALLEPVSPREALIRARKALEQPL